MNDLIFSQEKGMTGHSVTLRLASPMGDSFKKNIGLYQNLPRAFSVRKRPGKFSLYLT